MSWPGSQRLGLALSPRARRAPSLHGLSPPRSGLRESSDRNRGLFAGWEGAASLGLSFPLSPPPASYLQRGWGGSSLEFLSPFVLRTAGGVFLPVNPSLALPQFKKAPSDCSPGLLHSRNICHFLFQSQKFLLGSFSFLPTIYPLEGPLVRLWGQYPTPCLGTSVPPAPLTGQCPPGTIFWVPCGW